MTTQGPHQGMPAQPAGHPQQVPINDQVANLKHLVGQLKECFSVSFFDLCVSVLTLFSVTDAQQNHGKQYST